MQHMLRMDRFIRPQRLGGVAQSPEHQFVECRLELGTGGGESVPDLAASGLSIDVDDTVGFEVAESTGQRLRGDAGHAFHQIGEPLRPGHQVAYDEEGPPTADAIEGLGQHAGVAAAAWIRFPHSTDRTTDILVDKYYL